MSVGSRFTIDTNILIYSIDRDSKDKRRAATDAIKRVALGDAVLVMQVLGEFFHATTRKRLLTTSEAREILDHWAAVFPSVEPKLEDLDAAIRLIDKHSVSFWDATLVATAARAGCDYLISEDLQDGRELLGVEVINPFARALPT